MKTKTLFMVCLLFGIGLTQLSAQPDKYNPNRANVVWMTEQYWGAPVFCGGVNVNFLEGNLTFHYVFHNQSMVLIIHGEVKSTRDGEVFKLCDIEKSGYSPIPDNVTWHVNLKGNEGTHYILDCTIDPDYPDQVIVSKAICLENEKK
jgi:hypothetical protein